MSEFNADSLSGHALQLINVVSRRLQILLNIRVVPCFYSINEHTLLCR